MLTIALATENNEVDGHLFVELARLVTGLDLEPWRPTIIRFHGWKSVVGNLPFLLETAADDGVQHAIVAIDNDGGEKKRPVHQAAHNADVQARDPQHGCATCLLTHQLPGSWSRVGGKHCIVVPV